jgi:hypothetical protein
MMVQHNYIQIFISYSATRFPWYADALYSTGLSCDCIGLETTQA